MQRSTNNTHMMTLNRWAIFAFAAVCVGAAIVGVSEPVRAQAPDQREIRPVVMLLVDSSGSMERKPDCICAGDDCANCMPVCRGTNPDRNRWAHLYEALVGQFNTAGGYSCSIERRTGSRYTNQFDQNYYIDHVRLPTNPGIQGGLIDTYADRAKFGLMTFDNVNTIASGGSFSSLINLAYSSTYRYWNARGWTTSALGGYSYGGPKPFRLPGCRYEFMMDNGARNESGAAGNLGRMISVGSDTANRGAINSAIKNSLGAVRPYGATPIAGMLDDASYYFRTHEDVAAYSTATGKGDPYYACRDRYAVLITDGYPSGDMRGHPYYCERTGRCPYDRPVDIANRMCRPDASGECSGGAIDGLYVVGFDINDPSTLEDDRVRAGLDDLAAVGGTGSAYFAENRNDLINQISFILDTAAPGTTTRTVASFGSSASTTNEFQFNSGYRLNFESDPDLPWTGVLERRRYLCDGITSVEDTIDDSADDAADDFGATLNNRTTARNILSIRRGALGHFAWLAQRPYVGRFANNLISDSTLRISPNPWVDRWGTMQPLTNSWSWHEVVQYRWPMNVNQRRDEVIAWLRGDAGTPREGKRLGAIIHSSPVVVGPPKFDIEDESYNLFRRSDDVASRPAVVYVGSNDGLLHAFAAEDHTVAAGAYAGRRVTAGEEIFAFAPPWALQKVQEAVEGHTLIMDGSPVAKDVILAKQLNAAPATDDYHSLVVTGMRGGGGGVSALDVTDPFSPVFLWQYTGLNLSSETYGEPAIGQVTMSYGSMPVHRRGIVIVPGGKGTPTGAICTPPANATPAGGRVRRRCWQSRGRSLHVLDATTGHPIKVFGTTDLPAPIQGSVAIHSNTVGNETTAAYFTDADGVIWKLDLTPVDPNDWSVKPLWDIFRGRGANQGHSADSRPVLSTDLEGNVVVVQGTGDVDDLETVNTNHRIVSVTDKVTTSASGALVSIPTLNFQHDLGRSERITGPIKLFNSNIFFSTFVSVSDPSNACQVGESYIYGMEYQSGGPSNQPIPALPDGSGGVQLRSAPYANQIIMGVAVARRPVCSEGELVDDYYAGRAGAQRFEVNRVGGGDYQLIAQASGSGGMSDAIGGSVNEVRIDLPKPTPFTLTRGVAGLTD